jgi:membrane protease YdiL (CAAX protease family)
LKRGALIHIKPIEKFALFLGILVISFFITAFLGAILSQFLFGSEVSQVGVMDDWGRADVLRLSKILQVVSHIGLFIIPAFIFSKLVSNDSKKYLNLENSSKKFWLLVPVVFIGLLFTNSLLYELNRSIDFSFISKEFQYNLEYNQALSDKKIDAFVGNTPLSFFINLIVICIIPAIAEELTFRGVLQQLGFGLFNSPYLGITFAAFIFAIIHFQPLNFLPIFTLGWVFGYIVYITGSLWITILLHFLNNAFRLILLHLEDFYDLSFLDFNMIWSIIIIIICGVIIYKKVPFRTLMIEKQEELSASRLLED